MEIFYFEAQYLRNSCSDFDDFLKLPTSLFFFQTNNSKFKISKKFKISIFGLKDRLTDKTANFRPNLKNEYQIRNQRLKISQIIYITEHGIFWFPVSFIGVQGDLVISSLDFRSHFGEHRRSHPDCHRLG